MPYERTTHKLETLIATAVRNAEIQEAAHWADVDEETLFSYLLIERVPSVWAAAASEIEDYNELDRARNVKLAELRNAKSSLRRLQWLSIGTSAIGTIGVLASIYVVLSKFLSLPDNLRYLPVLGSLIVGLLVYRYLYDRYTVGRASGRGNRILTEKQRELEIDELGEKLVAAEQNVEKALIEKGILPELRSIINWYLTPSYDTVLNILVAPGMAEVFNPTYEVLTRPKELLHRLLSTMPGGNIGVAGPPGVGKTTLLQSFCSMYSIKDRPILSVMASVPIGYDAREFVLHLFSSVCRRVLDLEGSPPCPWTDAQEIQDSEETEAAPKAVINLRNAVASVLPGLFLMASELYLTNDQRFFFGLGFFLVVLGLAGLLGMTAIATGLVRRQALSRRQVLSAEFGPLAAQACRELGKIKFQQSYSSGWGGSLRIPPMPLARHQLSLPDILDAFREFLAIARLEYEIIIGIDDLDKASDEQAQRFLTEVKAISGLESCFYLVSVPEAAMSSFEQRPLLNLHDNSFDAFFDALVRMELLSLDDAQRLVKRRVQGVPVPFVDFCYCMAGGLPRDFIRVLRSMFEHRSITGESNLSALCDSLVRSDLRAKLDALSLAATASISELGAYHTWETVHNLEALLASDDYLFGRSKDLLEINRTLLDGASRASAPQAEPAEVAANRESLVRLSTRLGVYLYYCVTLLEFFGHEDLSEETLIAAERSGALERLVKARQFLANSPRIAESIITEFRKRYNLDTPPGVYENPA